MSAGPQPVLPDFDGGCLTNVVPAITAQLEGSATAPDWLPEPLAGARQVVLLVLDGTSGQNAIRQAEVFTKSIGCTGVILTKLDGTAKGGVVVAVRQTMKLPIKFIGVGEALDDLQPFDADTFVESLFA